MEPAIVVIGSSNMDLISYVDRLPKPGETLRGSKFQIGFGGKGSNQAIAASKLGAKLSLMVKVGSDTFGAQMKENFQKHGISMENVLTSTTSSTGVAAIGVAEDGANNIIIVPGANDELTAQDVDEHTPIFEGGGILLTQLEIKLETTMHALRVAKSRGLLTILNTAPAIPLPAEVFPLVDIICANETELETLTGSPVITKEDAIHCAKQLINRGAKQVLVTLGSKGCLWVESDSIIQQPIEQEVKAIDTTGAGDCFLGTFAYFLGRGYSIQQCMEKANYVAGISVQAEGTQSSFPDKSLLPAALWN